MSHSQCKVCSLHLQEFSVLSVSILFKHSLWRARQCWLERQRKVVSEFMVSLIYRSPQNEFQDNQDYTETLTQKNKTKQIKQNKNSLRLKADSTVSPHKIKIRFYTQKTQWSGDTSSLPLVSALHNHSSLYLLRQNLSLNLALIDSHRDPDSVPNSRVTDYPAFHSVS